ncbi:MULTISPECIES: hypothetical protein [unclassified Mesorhizobium]|uniref:hypothetical protein n=1 Tax=unclassified Mesorhizobium TaxID=325217 RepID=UPI00333D90E5
MQGSGGASFGGRRSVSTNPGDGTDGGGERRDIVEHAERDEVVGPAGIVLAVLAGADQDAGPEDKPNWPTWM